MRLQSVLLQITLPFASSLEIETGLEGKGKKIQVNNRNIEKFCCVSFSVREEFGTLRLWRKLNLKIKGEIKKLSILFGKIGCMASECSREFLYN
jgi:hypothetical protein